MKVSSKTNLIGGHGHGMLKIGKEVCLCGRPAIKWKLSSWVCDRCNRIEEMTLVRADRKDKESDIKDKSSFYDVVYKCGIKFS